MSCGIAFDHKPVKVDIVTPIDELPTFKQYRVTYSGYRSTFNPWNLDASSGISGVTGSMVNESGLQGTTSPEIVTYTRLFSGLPPDHINYQSYAYTAPAVRGFVPYPGRTEIARRVMSRMVFQYMRVSGPSTGNGNAQPTQNLSNFPFQPLSKFRIFYTGSDVESNTLHWTGDFEVSTTPTADTYFSSTVGTEIIVESDVDLWMGNIFVRRTRYVVAI